MTFAERSFHVRNRLSRQPYRAKRHSLSPFQSIRKQSNAFSSHRTIQEPICVEKCRKQSSSRQQSIVNREERKKYLRKKGLFSKSFCINAILMTRTGKKMREASEEIDVTADGTKVEVNGKVLNQKSTAKT